MRKKIPILNQCLGGCTITLKTKINIFGNFMQKIVNLGVCDNEISDSDTVIKTVELENNLSELMNHKNRHQGPYKVQQKRIIKVIFYTKWREKKKLCGKEKVDIMVPTNN